MVTGLSQKPVKEYVEEQFLSVLSRVTIQGRCGLIHISAVCHSLDSVSVLPGVLLAQVFFSF